MKTGDYFSFSFISRLTSIIEVLEEKFHHRKKAESFTFGPSGISCEAAERVVIFIRITRVVNHPEAADVCDVSEALA